MCFVLVACNDGGNDGGGVAPPAVGLNVAGIWAGSASAPSGSGAMSLNLFQGGSTVSGGGSACLFSGGGCITISSVSANTSGTNYVSGTMSGTHSSCTTSINFSATVTGIQMNGSFSGVDSCTGSFSGGSFTLLKQ